MPTSPLRRSSFAVAAAAALALTACSSASSGSSSTKGSDPGALQIYSAQHEDLTAAWAKAFTADTGIATEVREGQDASMGQQIVEEGDATPADVFLTENSPAMTQVERAKMLAPIDQATRDRLPSELVPSSGDWVPIAARSTVLVYNTTMISQDELPASMMDLAKPQWNGRWGGAPGGADFQAIVAGMLEEEGPGATKAWLTDLKEHGKIFQNNIATMKAVSAGEVPVGIMYHYYWYRDQAGDKQGSADTKLHYFGNEDPGAFVSLSGGGVLKNADDPEDAQAFMRWITGPEGQQVLVDSKSMEYPVATGVAPDSVLPTLESLDAPRVDPFTLDSRKVIDLMTDVGIL